MYTLDHITFNSYMHKSSTEFETVKLMDSKCLISVYKENENI